MYCTICEECVTKDCVLDDDLYDVLKEMHESDGIIFVVPKYLSVPSKFMAFLERLASIVHMRKHNGYEGPPVNPDYTLFKEGKPFCIFALSGRGNFGEQHINTIVDYAEYLGMNLVPSDHTPLVAVDVKAGDVKGEVLVNKIAIKQCRELAQKLMTSSRN
jgi:multimeric flavodoxin WrbA